MFTKKKLVIFFTVFITSAMVFFWLNSTLTGSFGRVITSTERRTATALAQGMPANPDELVDYIRSIERMYPGLSVLYLEGYDFNDASIVIPSNDSLTAFLNSIRFTQDFRIGMESAYYDVLYFSPLTFRVNNRDVRLMYVPVLAEDAFDISGTLLVLIDNQGYGGFIQLIQTLMFGVLVAIGVVLFVALFTRDPVVSYIIIGLFAIVGIFVVYPLFEALRLTFLYEGEFSFETWRRILGNREYRNALWGSMQLGILTATVSTLIGFLFAFTVYRTRIKYKKFISTIATLPVISPPFSLTLSIILLFGNNGFITRTLLGATNFSIYGLGGLVLVQTISMFPIAFLTLSGVLQAIDSTLEEASMDMNAGKLETFMRVTLPLAMPGVLSAWLLVFTNSLADFANPLLLAGSYRVLSVEAYIEVTGLNRLGNGAALSFMLLLPTLTAFLAQRYWVGRKSFVTVTGKPSSRLSDLVSPGVRWVLTFILALIIIFIIGLYGTIFAGSFVANWGIDYSFTTRNITEALVRGREAIRDTFTLSAIATPIAGILAMIGAVLVVRKKFVGKRLLEGLILTPFAIPGTMIGISYILAFNKPPFLLVGTGLIIVINYVIRELPVGLEGGVATLRQIDPAIEEAASDLGADSQTVFRTVVLPLIRPAFISSMSYTFVRSMTAVSAIIFLISARWYHMTVLIYNFSENLRFGLASVLATTLILIVLAVFGLLRLLVRKSDHLEKTVTI